MGRRGPKPAPTKLKKLRGNPGKRKVNHTGEPQPLLSKDFAPEVVGEDAQAFIAKYAPRLKAAQLVTDLDEAELEMMAGHYAIAMRALRIIEREGVRIKDAGGAMRRHPVLQPWRDNSLAFKSYAQDFGMNPSARSTMRLQDGTQLDFEMLKLEEELFGDVVMPHVKLLPADGGTKGGDGDATG